jgi:hypothetical protein
LPYHLDHSRRRIRMPSIATHQQYLIWFSCRSPERLSVRISCEYRSRTIRLRLREVQNFPHFRHSLPSFADNGRRGLQRTTSHVCVADSTTATGRMPSL